MTLRLVFDGDDEKQDRAAQFAVFSMLSRLRDQDLNIGDVVCGALSFICAAADANGVGAEAINNEITAIFARAEAKRKGREKE